MPRHRFALLPILLCVLSLVRVLAPANTLASTPTTTLQKHLTHELALAGSLSGGLVYDLSTKQTLFSERAADLRAPASVEKLYTATAALERLGPEARLETTVLGVGHLAAGGVWEGSIYLHGGGDPTFGTTAFIASHYGGLGTSVTTLVQQLVHTDAHPQHHRRRRGRRVLLRLAARRAFQRLPGGPLPGRHTQRARVQSRRKRLLPRSARPRGVRRARTAARAEGRRGQGQRRQRRRDDAGRRDAARGRALPTVAQLLGLTLPPSDNFFAETLVKDLGARFGGAGTTAAGARVVRETLAAGFGLHPQIVDGSGLSREDRTSPQQIVTLLTDLSTTTLGTTLRDDMAVAGRSGTLAERMRGTAAAGRCQGKTGTLTGVSNLVGYCQDSSGEYLAFAFFNDGIATEAAHVLQDNMTITLADY